MKDFVNWIPLRISVRYRNAQSHLDMKIIIRYVFAPDERWGAGVETQKNVRGVFGGWGRVPFTEPYAPSLSTIYDAA